MNRATVIQRIIDRTCARSYLEIGVRNGETFLQISAKNKIAVDPEFVIPDEEKDIWTSKVPANEKAVYCQETSDEFFANRRIKKKSMDVVFVDGLHTHEQSLIDVDNILTHGHKKTVIVLHDCSPPNKAAACPAASIEEAASINPPDWGKEWCGNVWKTVCYLRAFRKDLKVFVLDCDYGLGIITRGNPEDILDFTADQFAQLSYDDLAANRQKLLNLKRPDYLDQFNGLKTMRRRLMGFH